MTPDQVDRLEMFRSAPRSDRLDILFSFELARRLADDKELQEHFQQVLDILWPDYLAGL